MSLFLNFSQSHCTTSPVPTVTCIFVSVPTPTLSADPALPQSHCQTDPADQLFRCPSNPAALCDHKVSLSQFSMSSLSHCLAISWSHCPSALCSTILLSNCSTVAWSPLPLPHCLMIPLSRWITVPLNKCSLALCPISFCPVIPWSHDVTVLLSYCHTYPSSGDPTILLNLWPFVIASPLVLLSCDPTISLPPCRAFFTYMYINMDMCIDIQIYRYTDVKIYRYRYIYLYIFIYVCIYMLPF